MCVGKTFRDHCVRSATLRGRAFVETSENLNLGGKAFADAWEDLGRTFEIFVLKETTRGSNQKEVPGRMKQQESGCKKGTARMEHPRGEPRGNVGISTKTKRP